MLNFRNVLQTSIFDKTTSDDNRVFKNTAIKNEHRYNNIVVDNTSLWTCNFNNNIITF